MAIKKTKLNKSKVFDLNEYKKKHTNNPQHPKEYYYYPKCIQEAIGIEGVVKSSMVNVFGHSDTGKTTFLLTLMKEVMRQGDLPVLILTENKFSWDYAKLMGIEFEEEIITHNDVDVVDENTGEVVPLQTYNVDGDFIVKTDCETLEETFEFMREIINDVKTGKLQRNVCFLYDSIGSLGAEYVQGEGKKMAVNATVVGNYIRADISSKINTSAFIKKNREFNGRITALFISHPSMTIPSGIGMPTLSALSSKAIKLAATHQFRTGGVISAGTRKLNYTYQGKTVTYGMISKITVTKNHDTGVQYENVKIAITPHGYIENDKNAFDEYKKKYKKYFADILDVNVENFDELVKEDIVEDGFKE